MDKINELLNKNYVVTFKKTVHGEYIVSIDSPLKRRRRHYKEITGNSLKEAVDNVVEYIESIESWEAQYKKEYEEVKAGAQLQKKIGDIEGYDQITISSGGSSHYLDKKEYFSGFSKFIEKNIERFWSGETYSSGYKRNCFELKLKLQNDEFFNDWVSYCNTEDIAYLQAYL